MALGIKVAGQHLHTAELVFYRGLVSVVFMAVVLRQRRVALTTPVPMLHVWRSMAGVFSLTTWFYAIAHLPLATAMTLNYMSALWVATFVVGGAMLVGQARRQGPLMASVLSGFVGVVLMLRPSLAQDQALAALVGLMSGLGAAMAYLQVGALGQAGEPEGRTVFYFSIGTTLTGALGVAWQGLTPWAAVPLAAALWVVPIGVLATLGQWALTRAYGMGPNLLVANLQYSGIIFAAFYGWLLFGDQPDATGWGGMALIIASGVVATLLRHRALPRAPVDEPAEA